jgi:hypothetical protein
MLYDISMCPPLLPGQLRLVCSAQLGRLYHQHAEGVVRLVPPPHPIQGVPLTSRATLQQMPRDFFHRVVFNFLLFHLCQHII